MPFLFQNTLAALAAVAIFATSFTAVLTIPMEPAVAASFAAPILA